MPSSSEFELAGGKSDGGFREHKGVEIPVYFMYNSMTFDLFVTSTNMITLIDK